MRIEKDIIKNDIHDFIKSFERLGFIDDRICQKARTEESFSVLYLNVTNRCNLHCSHCSYPQVLNDSSAELTEYEILNFLDDFYNDLSSGCSFFAAPDSSFRPNSDSAPASALLLAQKLCTVADGIIQPDHAAFASAA